MFGRRGMRSVHYLIALAISAGGLMASAMGCELIASVDRSAIGDGGGGGGTGGGGGGTGGEATTTTTTGGGMGGQGGTGGGGCTSDCANGEACTDAAACTSGFCASGVCCDAACDGPCEACTAALKESGADDGTCGAASANTSCGDTAACAAGQAIGADLCDNAGQCVDGGMTTCDPYVCDAAGTACLSACAADTDCISTHFCNMMNQCVPKKAPGQNCTGTNQCTSGFCVDSVCCDTACDQTCQACNVAGSLGTCSPAAVGSTEAMCMGTMACAAGGTCKLVNGETCAMGTQCVSGNCADGVCCNTACGGDCQACNIAGTLGTCSNVMQGTIEPLCSAPANVCNNMGQCKLGAGEPCAMGTQCASGTCSAVTFTCAAP